MVNIDNLFKMISERGISQSKLAENTSISTGNISDWKKGKSMPSAVKLDELATYFDCSVDYLLGRTDNPNPSNNVTLSNDQNRLLQMYSLLSDMEKGEILGELKAMTANKRPIQTIRAVARSVDNRPPRLITGDFSDILDAPDISDKY